MKKIFQKHYFSLFLFLPLLFSPFTGETEGVKLVFAIAWALLFLIAGFFYEKSPPGHTFIIPGILVLGLVSTLLSQNPAVAFLGDNYRYLGFLLFAAFFSLIVFCPSLFSKKQEAHFISLLRLSGFLTAVTAGLLVCIGGNLFEGRWIGTLGNANYLGQFLAVTSFFALIEVFKRKNFTSTLIFLPQLFALLHTGNRAAWLGFGLATLLYFGSHFKKHPLKSFTLASLFLLTFASQWERWLALESIGARLEFYQEAARGLLIHPLFGFGIGAYSAVFSSPAVDRAHQFFLDWGLGLGLPSLILIVILCALTFRSFYKTKSPLTWGFLALFVALQSSFMGVTDFCLFATFMGFAQLRFKQP